MDNPPPPPDLSGVGKQTSGPGNYVLPPLQRSKHSKEDGNATLLGESFVWGIIDNERGKVFAKLPFAKDGPARLKFLMHSIVRRSTR